MKDKLVGTLVLPFGLLPAFLYLAIAGLEAGPVGGDYPRRTAGTYANRPLANR